MLINERKNTLETARAVRTKAAEIYNTLDKLVEGLQAARELPESELPKTPGITLFLRPDYYNHNKINACDSLEKTCNYVQICQEYLTKLGLPTPAEGEAYLVHFQATVIRKVK